MPISSSSSKNNNGSGGGNSRNPGSDGPMHVYAPEPENNYRNVYNMQRDRPPQTPPGTLYDPDDPGIRIPLQIMTRREYDLKKKREASIPVSSPEDKEELEADQVAEEVMTDLQPEKKKKKLSEETSSDQVMGKGTTGGTLDAGTAEGVRNLQGKGSPLSDRTRVDMERSFGADFSGVRIHTGPEAATLSRSMNARAFTYGNNIAFNRNEYSPDSQSGKRLLAHELTHTVQQGAVGRKLQREKDDHLTDESISLMTSEKKRQIAIERAPLSQGLFNELGSIPILIGIMAVSMAALIALAATGYGALAEAIGLVLLAAGAGVSIFQIAEGIFEIIQFWNTAGNANTVGDIDKAGKFFASAMAKIGIGTLFLLLSAFGAKKAIGARRARIKPIAGGNLPGSFADIVRNPRSLFGKSPEEVRVILGEGWTEKPYGRTGTGWKFMKDDKMVFYHEGGRHGGIYYGFSSAATGKVKIVGNNYKPLPGDKAKIIHFFGE